MTCEECERILFGCDAAGSGTSWLRGTILNLAKSHIQECSFCRARMSEVARMKNGLDHLRGLSAQLQAPPEVERRLVEAFHKEKNGGRLGVLGVFLSRPVWGSAAMVQLTLVVLWAYFALKPTPSVTVRIVPNSTKQGAQLVPGTSGGSNLATPNPSTEVPVMASTPFDEDKHGRPFHGRVKEKHPVEPSNDLALNGGGSIVRVTLPLSSLMAMGVPAHPEASDPRVTADVMLDPFGAVLGVRLVDAESKLN